MQAGVEHFLYKLLVGGYKCGYKYIHTQTALVNY